MKRYIYILLFAIVLVAPFVVRLVVARESPGDTPAASGPVQELVIVTPHTQDIRRAYERAFTVWHQQKFGSAVRIVYLTPGGTNDIVRNLNDKYVRYRGEDSKLVPVEQVDTDIDMVWGGGDVTFENDFKPVLQPVKLDPAIMKAAFPTPDLNGVALYERTRDGTAPKWVGVVLSSFGIIYNSTMYQTLGLAPPEKWEDLANPQLAGMVALADPTRSGSAAATYMVSVQRKMADAEDAFFVQHPELKGSAELAKNEEYQKAIAAGWKNGMRQLLLTAANARYFTDSASQVPNDVGNGEAAAGVAIDFYARVYEQQIGKERIQYVAPRGATAITPDPIGILYGVKGEREILANRFIEFLLTPEGQKLWNLTEDASPYVERSLRRLPIRRDVYADRAGWADDTNPFEEAADFNQRQAWMTLFSDTRPIWAAAWIDSRSNLKEAYKTILAVSDPAERAQLLAELSDIPIEMSDVAAQRAKRTEMRNNPKPGEDARLWLAQQRMTWAQKFRDHYNAVAAKAR